MISLEMLSLGTSTPFSGKGKPPCLSYRHLLLPYTPHNPRLASQFHGEGESFHDDSAWLSHLFPATAALALYCLVTCHSNQLLTFKLLQARVWQQSLNLSKHPDIPKFSQELSNYIQLLSRGWKSMSLHSSARVGVVETDLSLSWWTSLFSVKNSLREPLA